MRTAELLAEAAFCVESLAIQLRRRLASSNSPIEARYQPSEAVRTGRQPRRSTCPLESVGCLPRDPKRSISREPVPRTPALADQRVRMAGTTKAMPHRPARRRSTFGTGRRGGLYPTLLGAPPQLARPDPLRRASSMQPLARVDAPKGCGVNRAAVLLPYVKARLGAGILG